MEGGDTILTALQIGEKVTLIGFLIAALIYTIIKVERCSKKNETIVTSNTEAVHKLCDTLDDMSNSFRDMRNENNSAHDKVITALTDIKIDVKTKIRSA